MSANAQIVFNVLTIIALILGPVTAIQIQVYLEKRREEKRKKLWIFRELMVTRSTLLSPRHVEALNAIQMEFSSKNDEEKPVIDAWQDYITHLNNHAATEAWATKQFEILMELLLQMAVCLGYHDFNKARIKSESYLPKYFSDIETEQNDLRRAAVEVFRGRQSLRVNITEEPPRPNPFDRPPQ